jgi:hypothetical protein
MLNDSEVLNKWKHLLTEKEPDDMIQQIKKKYPRFYFRYGLPFQGNLTHQPVLVNRSTSPPIIDSCSSAIQVNFKPTQLKESTQTEYSSNDHFTQTKVMFV